MPAGRCSQNDPSPMSNFGALSPPSAADDPSSWDSCGSVDALPLLLASPVAAPVSMPTPLVSEVPDSLRSPPGDALQAGSRNVANAPRWSHVAVGMRMVFPYDTTWAPLCRMHASA